jgi:N-acetylmuramoyl-L-alanine amidase
VRVDVDDVGKRLVVDGRPVPFVPSPNVGDWLAPRYAIIHYTAGPSTESVLATFRDPASAVSAHLIVDRDGTVTQCIPLDRVAWHAGHSSWNGEHPLNPVSIGIELVNWGRLERRGPEIVSWTGNPIARERCVRGVHPNDGLPVPWERYPRPQITACRRVLAGLHMRLRFTDILGHDEVSPRRKWDPGPAFPFRAVREAVLGPAAAAAREPVTLELRRQAVVVVHARGEDAMAEPLLAHVDILVRRGYLASAEPRGIDGAAAGDLAEILDRAPIAVVAATHRMLDDPRVRTELLAAGARRAGRSPILLVRIQSGVVEVPGDEIGEVGGTRSGARLVLSEGLQAIPFAGPGLDRLEDPEVGLFELSLALQRIALGRDPARAGVTGPDPSP